VQSTRCNFLDGPTVGQGAFPWVIVRFATPSGGRRRPLRRLGFRRAAPASGRRARPSATRIPGSQSAAKVTTAPTAPAAMSVPCVPIAALSGPVSAKESGSRPMEMSQSRLDTRPSISPGTWRCLAVAQTIVPAVSSALKARLASISCHTAVANP